MGALHAIHAVSDVDRAAYDAEPEKREIGFGIVDPQVRALKNGYATAVYEVLAAHANPAGVCWPPLSTICEAVGWSKPTVIKAVKALTDAGLVTVEQQRRRGCIVGNRYTLPFRNRTKSTSLNQSPSIMTGRVNDVDLDSPSRVNDVDSTSKGYLPDESTTFTQTGKRRLHKQDVVKQDSSKQDNLVTATAVTGTQAPQVTKSASKPKTKTQTEQEQAAFALVDGYAVGSGRLKKDVVGRERYEARVTFTPLIDRYTADDIEGCAAWLKSDPFYQRGNVSPVAVVKAMPDWIAQGRPVKMTPRNGRQSVDDAIDGFLADQLGGDEQLVIEAKGRIR